eukprot:TRINITY_DN5151_c0_g1_i2.p1 TRINITY_DN5151_c0_g1~~TRINITY_DN5151_c0_g1_i2.p1  ORF type:complete len:191 (+),score=36.86 TRINITY_DN5151_c0_g1_i2:183-755(+)
MSIRKIIRMGHPTLRQVASVYPKEKIGSEEFGSLIADMRATLEDSGGIGLAAPQIDISFQIAIIDIPSGRGDDPHDPPLPFGVYVNPVVTPLPDTSTNDDVKGYWEGCLSVPGLIGYVERPQHVRVEYLDQHGATKLKEFRGFHATVFQHEFDHLFGRLYLDRMKDMTRLCYTEEYQQFHAEQDVPELDD